jgi:hypothetical protein
MTKSTRFFAAFGERKYKIKANGKKPNRNIGELKTNANSFRNEGVN